MDRIETKPTKNHIVRTKVQQMRQESQKVKETIYFAYWCGNGILGDARTKAKKRSGFQHH